MRITFLAWRDPGHPEGGGSEEYVEQVARRLVRRGHEVTVRSATYPNGPADEVIDGVRHRRSGGRLTVYLKGLAFLLSPEGRRQDVVVDVVNGVPFCSPLVRRRTIVALVHHLHREQWSIIYPNWKGRLGWAVESRFTPWLYRNVPFVTVSQHSAADLVGIGVEPSRVTVVTNGLPHDVPPSDEPRSRAPRLCVVSRLVPHKQIEHAIHVVAALHRDFPGLHLDVVGDGWWRDRLVAETHREIATDLVTFHGHVRDDVRDRLLARSWLMVLPSVKEGWGISVTEAARQGTPTVGYRSSGGLVESIHDGRTGALVDDLDSMVAAVRDLLGDRPRLSEMSRHARDWADELDWDTTAEQFETALTARPRRQRSP